MGFLKKINDTISAGYKASKELAQDAVDFGTTAVTGRVKREDILIRDTEMVNEIKKFQRDLATQILRDGEVNRYLQNKAVDEMLENPNNARGLINNPELSVSPSTQAAAQIFLDVSNALQERESAVRKALDIGDGAVRYNQENKHDITLHKTCKDSIEVNKEKLFSKPTYYDIVMTFLFKSRDLAREMYEQKISENDYEKITKKSAEALEKAEQKLSM